MSTIVTRAGKGTPLTNTEVDSNFTNLNTDKIQVVGTPTSGQAVVWNGTAWIPGTAASKVTLSSSAPAGAGTGDRWLDSDTGIEYLYATDADSSQWVEFGPTAIVVTSGDALAFAIALG